MLEQTEWTASRFGRLPTHPSIGARGERMSESASLVRVRSPRRLAGPMLALWLSCGVSGCGGSPPNSPYPAGETARDILYSSFSERPKHLDPARAYSSDEFRVIGQIYEPPLQYHYLKRPYQLEPLTLAELPSVRYLDHTLKTLPATATDAEIAFSEYELRLKPEIRYQPHPAFVRRPDGSYRFHDLPAAELDRIGSIGDFPETATRVLESGDYAYQIKRLVHPAIHSPIAELMKDYIVGLKELSEQLERDWGQNPSGFVDLRGYDLAGVDAKDPRYLRIRLRGKYPQFRFWLAMPFFAPMPWEADRFYAQPGLIARNVTLDWFPVGTGAYLLAENNPNRRMVLRRNPNFHAEFYPGEGEPGDEASGLLADRGRALPFVDQVNLVLEKETIPYWSKFIQGYYDSSGLASDNFDQAVQFGGQGNAELTPEMTAKGIGLSTSVSASTFYLGFNMLDPVVGGLDEPRCKLRQAISIALDYEEFIAIFMNGRGVSAHGMVPPGIFGHVDGPSGMNRYVYDWIDDAPRRKDLAQARTLLAEAGYPGGVDERSGKPLVLNLDTSARGPDDKSLLNWYRKQFAKIGIQLVLRSTDYNQFQQKMSNGNAQIYQWGWNADYPDPENFFFLLYGPNAKVLKGGENASNYRNPEFDRLFERMRSMDDGPERLGLIQALEERVRHDAPWVFGLHPKNFSLHHAWYRNLKPNLMADNQLKYQRVLAGDRARRQREWNRPLLWPLVVLPGLVLLALAPAWFAYRRRLASGAFRA